MQSNKMPINIDLEEKLRELSQRLEKELASFGGRDLEGELRKHSLQMHERKEPKKKKSYKKYEWIEDFWAFYDRAEEYRRNKETDRFLKEVDEWYVFTLEIEDLLPSDRKALVYTYLLNSYWKVAIDYARENKLAEAGFILGRMAKIDGRLDGPYYIIFDGVHSKEKIDKFIECIDAALKRDPNNWGCLIARQAFIPSNEDLVELMIRHYREFYQHDAVDHYILGKKLNDRGEHEAALAELIYAEQTAEENSIAELYAENEVFRAKIKIIVKDSEEYANKLQAGLETFFKGDGIKADVLLKEALELKPGSKVCKAYLEAAQQRKKEPIPIEI